MNIAARRACARIAWRQAMRAPWRSALIMAMVALPISALTFAGTVIATAITTPEERTDASMGAAELYIGSYHEDLAEVRLERALPEGWHVITLRSSDETILASGELISVRIEEPSGPLSSPVVAPMRSLSTGRAPEAVGEAALHPRLLTLLDSGIGEEVRVGDLDLRVTGTVIDPTTVSALKAIVGPGTFARGGVQAGVDGFLIDLPDDVDPAVASETVHGVEGVGEVWTRDTPSIVYRDSPALGVALSFAGAVLALFVTGLVSGAAFVVGMRRQLRALGLLGAAGGTPRQIRATVLLGGTSLGLSGATAGVALGLAGAYAAHPHLDHYTDSLVGPIVLSAPLIIGAVLLGTLAATAAAYLPARTAARVPVVESLAGRLPSPRPPGRLAWLGIMIFAIGIPITANGARSRDGAGLTIGMAALGAGLLLAIPLGVTLLGRLARFMPAGWRIAARDAARNGRRTAAALAAATLALTTAVAAASVAAGDERNWREQRPMDDGHLWVNLYSPEMRAVDPSRLLARLRAAFPDAILAPVAPAVFEATNPRQAEHFGGQVRDAWVTGLNVELGSSVEAGAGSGIAEQPSAALMIGTPDLLRALGAQAGIAALERGDVVAIGLGATDDGRLLLDLPPGRGAGERTRRLRASEVDAPVYGNEQMPRFLIAEDAARRLGMAPATSQDLLIANPVPLSDAQIAQARRIAAAIGAGFVTSGRDWIPSSVPLRAAAIGGSALLAIAIVALALALVGAEARRDRAILVAVGSGPSMRRRIAAANAALLTLVAGMLAIPAGFTPYAVIQSSRPDGYPVVFPWDAAVAVALIVPTLAAAVMFAASRSPKADALVHPVT